MGLRIKINDKWVITSTSNYYCINKIYKSKTKGEALKEIHYYNNMKDLLAKIIELEIMTSHATTFKEVMEIVENTKNILRQLIDLDLYKEKIKI